MKRLLAVAAAGVLSVGLVACGSSNNQETSNGSTSPTTSTPAPTPSNAEQVIAGLKAQGLPVTLSIVYNEKTDPNEKLGRPNGYTSKASFTIPQGDKSADKGSVDAGGSVEMFESEPDAKQRGEYIQTTQKSMNGLAGSEYSYVAGGALLRLTPKLTSTEAAKYGEALSKIMGSQATLVKATS